MAHTIHDTVLERCDIALNVPQAVSEALPEDDLRPVLLVFLLADPGGAEGGQVGQHCPPAPHREVSVLGAGDANALPRVRGNQSFDFSLEPLRKAGQQSVSACSERRHSVKSGTFTGTGLKQSINTTVQVLKIRQHLRKTKNIGGNTLHSNRKR